MQTFLKQVALDIYSKYGDEISNLNLVFPNRRAQVFFEKELLEIIPKPLWQPQYTSINDLVGLFSQIQTANPLKVLIELYNEYTKLNPSAEHFDMFYNWGELLIADFDTIDKYCVDAEKLYVNINNLAEIDNLFEDDTPEKEIVSNFWNNFKQSKSTYTSLFAQNWNLLFPLYTNLKTNLKKQGLGYSGMIYREASSKISSSNLSSLSQYIFIGFNALNTAEQRIFKSLQKNDVASFYWNADYYYLNDVNQEAGEFLRRNIKQFGEGETTITNTLRDEKNIDVVKAPTDIIQCKALSQKLNELIASQGTVGVETAIILTDENLLPVVLKSIPPQINNVNITMGAKVNQSVSFVFFERIISLQRRKKNSEFYYADLNAIISHPFIQKKLTNYKENKVLIELLAQQKKLFFSIEEITNINPELTELLQTPTTNDELIKYYTQILESYAYREDDDFVAKENNEYTTTIIIEIERFNTILKQTNIELSEKIFYKVLLQNINSVRVPYIGEPLSGLQIMGILESRCLDFQNVFILSMTDNTFPGNKGANSYIPLNLKRGFGLPTPWEHSAVWAYYFYQLIARAKNVTLMYSTVGDELKSTEPSRYIYQLIYESGQNIKQSFINLKIESNKISGEITQEKTTLLLDKLEKLNFTPSKINDYIDCPLRFYYKHLKYLKPEQKIDDQIKNSDLGQILHLALEKLYTPLKNQEHFVDTLKGYVDNDDVLQQIINQSIEDILEVRAEAQNNKVKVSHIKKLTLKQLKTIIVYDIQSNIRRIVELESVCQRVLVLSNRTVQLQGRIDRIDELQNRTIRVVDYKSGKSNNKIDNISSLFSNGEQDNYKAHNHYALQTLIYGLIYHDATPTILSVKDMSNESFSPYIFNKQTKKEIVTISKEVHDELIFNLENLFNDLFNSETPFYQTKHIKCCEFCDFNIICQKQYNPIDK